MKKSIWAIIAVVLVAVVLIAVTVGQKNSLSDQVTKLQASAKQQDDETIPKEKSK